MNQYAEHENQLSIDPSLGPGNYVPHTMALMTAEIPAPITADNKMENLFAGEEEGGNGIVPNTVG